METEKILELEKIPVVSSPSNTGYILTTLGRYPISFFCRLAAANYSGVSDCDLAPDGFCPIGENPKNVPTGVKMGGFILTLTWNADTKLQLILSSSIPMNIYTRRWVVSKWSDWHKMGGGKNCLAFSKLRNRIKAILEPSAHQAERRAA